MARNEPKLSDEAKTFVVQAIACFDPPSTVAEAVKRELGLTITRQAVEAYDPTKRAGRNIGPKWRVMFEETRKAFLAETARVGISHQVVRLRAIDRIAAKAESVGNIALALQALEQAAKEVGNSYSNRREIGLSAALGVVLDRPMTEDEWERSLPSAKR